MKIKKRSGEFRGRNWWAKARDYDELKLERVKNVHYDNAIIAKDIIKGYLRGEFEISEFADLVNQGIEDDYLMQEAGKARKTLLAEGEVMTLRANDYYLRKTTDTSDNFSWDNDFFRNGRQCCLPGAGLDWRERCTDSNRHI